MYIVESSDLIQHRLLLLLELVTVDAKVLGEQLLDVDDDGVEAITGFLRPTQEDALPWEEDVDELADQLRFIDDGLQLDVLRVLRRIWVRCKLDGDDVAHLFFSSLIVSSSFSTRESRNRMRSAKTMLTVTLPYSRM